MAPIFRLTPTAPGKARIDVTGVEIPANDEGLEVWFQRGDDLYIGGDGSWQSVPEWHRLERIPGPAATAFLAGPAIVDALAQVSHGTSFQACARWKGGEGAGGLRIAGELIGSAGLKEEPPPESVIGDRGGGSPILGPIPGGPSPPGPSDAPFGKRALLPWAVAIGVLLLLIASAGALWLGSSPGNPEQKTAGQDQPGVSQPPAVVSVPDQSGGPPASGGSGLPPPGGREAPAPGGRAGTTSETRQPATDHPHSAASPKPAPPGEAPWEASRTPPGEQSKAQPFAEPAPANGQADMEFTPATQPGRPIHPASAPSVPAGARSETETQAATGAAAEPEPAASAYDAPQLQGQDYVRWLADQSPDAATYQSQAKRRAKRGDCAAVILLYARAARSSPVIALQVARLYDPVDFRRSPCIDRPNPSNAREYYELAIDQGIEEAKSRLAAMDAFLHPGQLPVPPRRTWENRQ